MEMGKPYDGHAIGHSEISWTNEFPEGRIAACNCEKIKIDLHDLVAGRREEKMARSVLSQLPIHPID